MPFRYKVAISGKHLPKSVALRLPTSLPENQAADENHNAIKRNNSNYREVVNTEKAEEERQDF